MSNKLAIAIPTYNRSEMLKENLLLMLVEIKEFSIPVYISDDSTNNLTEIVVDDLKKIYKYIYYYKNCPGIGHDKNCIRTLGLAGEDYIWYIGDSMLIKPNGIRKVLEIIENDYYDFISVNAVSRKLNIPDRIFEKGNELLVDLAWHLTLTGATIYSKKIMDSLENIDLNKCKNFPQTSLVFEKFANSNCKLFWLNDKIIYTNKNKKSYWGKVVFEVFLYDWSFFISNLPVFYSNINKKYTIKKHSEKVDLFTLKKFLKYRSTGIFSLHKLLQYFKLIRFNSNVNIVLLFLISIINKNVILLIEKRIFNKR